MPANQPHLPRRGFLAALAGLGATAACAPRGQATAPARWEFGFGESVPENLEISVLAGGCFWGVQAVFAHVRGVAEAVSGYTGGHIDAPTYNQVTSGLSGHAEAVRVVFDPAVITYDEVLEIFFSVATDPTEVNRQGPDVGPQYRNEIFFTSAAQEASARAAIARLNASGAYRRPIATQVTPLSIFYPAETYHQDYLFKNPRQPYIVMHDMPKLEALQAAFPDRYSPRPVRLS